MQKRQVDDLAVFGGMPLFETPRHVGRPNIGDRKRFMARVDDMFDRRWLTNNGPNVVEFEERIAGITGAPYCVAVCNATIGLELVTKALELSGEVIVPSFTFVATAHALHWLGLTPVFCDVDIDSHTLAPKAVEELITAETCAILGVHTWGRGCDVTALQEIADRRGLRLIFDAAHAFGCSHGGQMIGAFGDAEVFSFHATKFLNSFEGGAITTRNRALADRLRTMRNFGFSGLDRVTSSGTNAKMTEISAAMGLTSLESMDEFIQTNRANYDLYRDLIGNIPGIDLYELPEGENLNFQYIVSRLDHSRTTISRDQIVEVLMAENIFARRYFYPGVHQMEPYRSNGMGARANLPATEQLTSELFQLPSGTAMSDSDIRDVAELLTFATRNGCAIAEQLARSSPRRAS